MALFGRQNRNRQKFALLENLHVNGKAQQSVIVFE